MRHVPSMRGDGSARLSPERLEERRLKAIDMLRSDKALTQAEVARRLNVTTGAVAHWVTAQRRGGRKALKARPHPGRPPKLDRKVLKGLPKILLKGAEAHGFETDVWTTDRIAKVIKREYEVAYHADHVGRLLHQLGLSWQKPVTRGKERDDDEIARWIRQEWPRLKKGQPGSAQ